MLNVKKEEEAYVSSHSDKKKYSYNRKAYDGNNFRTVNRVKANYVPTEKGRFNPLNKQGQVSKYEICDSKMHWLNKCPKAKTKSAS